MSSAQTRNDLSDLAQSVHETLEACWEGFESGFKSPNLLLASRFAHNLRQSLLTFILRLTADADRNCRTYRFPFST